jgi:hypothetical protein
MSTNKIAIKQYFLMRLKEVKTAKMAAKNRENQRETNKNRHNGI